MKLIKILQQHKWIVMIVVVLAATFYWYEWRPARIAAQCSEKALDVVLDEKGGYQRQIALYDFAYKICIRTGGSITKNNNE